MARAAERPPARAVVGRHVFYNNSAFDGGNATINADDDDAVAPDKRPLLPGQASSYANVTNAHAGINGVMIDVSGGLPLTALALIGSDLGLQARGAGAAAWGDAPAPAAIDIRPGAGVDGSDRITVVWTDGAIRNQWLRVTVKAAPDLGLPGDDVFAFGNLAGEAGDAPGGLRVSALDLAAVKRELSRPATITSNADVNRDGRVSALDVAALKANLSRALDPLGSVFASPLAAPPPAEAPRAQAARRVWDEDLAGGVPPQA